ncbi:DUF2510 domain-containing protein [Leucobacter musarum]|uniref:DUF2510 domain-containing protein n=1 Tax=Leucobacter musarum TaxID=1930747 RepID=UPI000949552D
MTAPTSPPSHTPLPPAAWYPDPANGHLRWWDGQTWGPYAPPQQAHVPVTPQPVQVHHPRYANKMPVSYVRPQQGHSITKHLLLGVFCIWINVLYISVSPNHYWHT